MSAPAQRASRERPQASPLDDLDMERVHGVDVSWLHRPQKDGQARPRAPSAPPASSTTPASPSPQIPQSPRVDGDNSAQDSHRSHSRGASESQSNKAPAASTNGMTPSPAEGSTPRATSKRPTLLSRNSAEKVPSDNRSQRRTSWISNISSRFTSGAVPTQGNPATPQVSKPTVNGTHVTSPQPDFEKVVSPSGQTPPRKEANELHPYVPQKPKEAGGSFFSSLTRRLSTNPQTTTPTKSPETGGVCPRRTMNVNRSRARCLVPELDQAKLRRVSFSVDVEIASGPRYKDDESPVDQAKSNEKNKVKERAEGEALKHPQAATDIKEGAGEKDKTVDETLTEGKLSDRRDDASPDDKKTPKQMTRKQEKKKRSEQERKERQEKKRRKAEENGQIPVELTPEDDDSRDSSSIASASGAPPAPPPKPHDRPTTDPVRIYRRCCQLRESPILKRITEQLMNPKCTVPGDPGTVQSLNLTGSRLQLADFITLGDWLAIVPVKRVLLEDADISDEGLRVVLAGLLAAKKPETTRNRRRTNSDLSAFKERVERAGVVDRLVLKNNPRITRTGWKHLALFLNMCKSIKAIDLSMIQFPHDLPLGTPKMSPRPDNAPPLPDAAEIFAKALAERQGGAVLEELILSECGLSSEQIRKLVDGAMVSGVSRLGLAGSQLDDDGFEHILTYVRSGICHVVDIGSNDLRGKLGKLAESLAHNPNCPVWGLSLASCNLDSEALKPLFPALVKLENFRFLDLSHNKGLFENDTTEGVHLLRKYIPILRDLKRVHLNDVGMDAKQAIALAEVLPEGPTLAHVAILGNSELSKLVANTDESSQEEACALYASLMAAVRVSSTIVCIDVDVPPPNNSEVVKALAKQVVAYCLRNMERMHLPSSLASEAAGSTMSQPSAADAPTSPQPDTGSEITVPDVLLHLVGHVDGMAGWLDEDEDPAPNSDYIVGGTGVVRALSYCLGEKAQELRRRNSGSVGIPSTPPTPGHMSSRLGGRTEEDKDVAAGAFLSQRQGRAKEMSKNLLGSARKIRGRLQPALLKEQDEMAYRRLLFLDKTLEGMIQRFEAEYPECRLAPTSGGSGALGTSPAQHALSFGSHTSTFDTATSPPGGISRGSGEGVRPGDGGSDDDDELGLRRPSRRGSEVSLASKALAIEEGRMHRIGHGIRRDLVHGVSSSSSASQSPSPSRDEKRGDQQQQQHDEGGVVAPVAVPGATDNTTHPQDEVYVAFEGIDAHLKELMSQRLGEMSGEDVKELSESTAGWDKAMDKIGANIEELREMRRRDPKGWEGFVESQVKARLNASQAPSASGPGADQAR